MKTTVPELQAIVETVTRAAATRPPARLELARSRLSASVGWVAGTVLLVVAYFVAGLPGVLLG